MKNLNIQNQNQQSTQTEKEDQMKSFETELVNYFNQRTETTGDGRFTTFKKHMDDLMKTHIKPLTGRSGTVSEGGGWRDKIKERFGGRGKKWCFVSLIEIMPTLEDFVNRGVDIANYKKHIEREGKAWIRFSGPRINNGLQCAAFEVRTKGSTFDQPKELHYIAVDLLDGTITSMAGTPHSLKLEKDPQVTPDDVVNKVNKVEVEDDEAPKTFDCSHEECVDPECPGDEVHAQLNDEVTEEMTAPTSNDPAEWETYLNNLELSAEVEDVIIDDEDEEDVDDSMFGVI